MAAQISVHNGMLKCQSSQSFPRGFMGNRLLETYVRSARPPSYEPRSQALPVHEQKIKTASNEKLGGAWELG